MVLYINIKKNVTLVPYTYVISGTVKYVVVSSPCPTDEQVNSSKQHGFAIFVINSTKEESNNCRRFTCLKNNLHKFNLKVKKCIFRFQSKGIRNLLEDNFIIIQRNLQKITITDSFINIFDL